MRHSPSTKRGERAPHREQAGQARVVVSVDVADPHRAQAGHRLRRARRAETPHQLPVRPLAFFKRRLGKSMTLLLVC